MTIQEYFNGWCQVVDLDNADLIMHKLSREKELCPLLNNVFKAFRICPFEDLRVVVIGASPYCKFLNDNPVATGLAFANHIGTLEGHYSTSLDILRESVIDFSMPHTNAIFDPSLESWGRQGVLLLNAELSCLKGRQGVHRQLWMPFTTNLLSCLSRVCTGIVYVLMGNVAMSLESCIDKRFNHIIRTRDPSWYAFAHTQLPDI